MPLQCWLYNASQHAKRCIKRVATTRLASLPQKAPDFMTQTVPVTAPPLPLPPTKCPLSPLPPTSRRPFSCGPCVSFVCGSPLCVLLLSNILDSTHQPLAPPLSRSLSESACPYKTSHLISFSGFIFIIVVFCVSSRCSLSPFRKRSFMSCRYHTSTLEVTLDKAEDDTCEHIQSQHTHTHIHTHT
jgi:hypothetical protein